MLYLQSTKVYRLFHNMKLLYTFISYFETFMYILSIVERLGGLS